MTTTSSSRQPVLFLSHGAGPAFYMEDEGRWKGVGRQSAWNRFLEGYGEQIGKNVRALLVISAHWECERPTVLAREKHTLLFDYYGFPSATYQLEWEARGDLELATQLAELLGGAPLERERGLDHGVFVPLKRVFPRADIPVVQLSMLSSMSAEEHLRLGEALAPLRDQGVLIVGSGMATHNLLGTGTPAASTAFNKWLRELLSDPRHSAEERRRALAEWERLAPHARLAHPREDHLIPVHVAAAAAGYSSATVIYDEMIGGAMSALSLRWD
mmetsp:Transcript_2978/g.7266  ORF Transcript_2978/g.7266 Transcript_2978/m.7266 type:complete len:272 (+) Transcript_2978:138-953(+)|eukprot:CAMPEP_0174241996 /NCGR_PEP_ID=MMETSP0417-20130205/25871_1 /TAXON_ID=242541 /ORGANISM="Mayorella sp, Strain BSH-02190019" /LENGTH=271 /DNA_ID=CAMNT_0015321337 /DNA_START=106 /DNA_END=921 /DNA_ORIENTATION=+